MKNGKKKTNLKPIAFAAVVLVILGLAFGNSSTPPTTTVDWNVKVYAGCEKQLENILESGKVYNKEGKYNCVHDKILDEFVCWNTYDMNQTICEAELG